MFFSHSMLCSIKTGRLLLDHQQQGPHPHSHSHPHPHATSIPLFFPQFLSHVSWFYLIQVGMIYFSTWNTLKAPDVKTQSWICCGISWRSTCWTPPFQRKGHPSAVGFRSQAVKGCQRTWEKSAKCPVDPLFFWERSASHQTDQMIENLKDILW